MLAHMHRASFEDEESVDIVHFEVQYTCAQLTSLTLDVTHVIKSPWLSPTFQCQGVQRSHVINAHSRECLGTRLGMAHTCTFHVIHF